MGPRHGLARRLHVRDDVLEEGGTVGRCHRHVAAPGGGTAQALQPEHVPGGLIVGKDSRVGQLQLTECVTHVGRLGPVEWEIHVQGIDAPGEHPGTLGVDPGRQVVAGPADDQDRDVVTGIALDLELRGRRKIGAVWHLGQLGPGATDVDRVLHDVTMAVRRIEHPLLARSHTEKEEGSRLTSPARRRRGVVVDRVGDEPEHESGLMAAQIEQRPLAVGMGGRRFAVHADEPELRRPVDEVPLDRGEDVAPAAAGSVSAWPA